MAREFDFSDLEDIEQKPKGKFDLTREFYERARRSDDPLGYDDYQEVKDKFGIYAPLVAQGAKTGDALLRGIMSLGYGASGLVGDITDNELLARDLAGMFESAGGRMGSPGTALTAPYRAGTTLSKAKVKQVADDVASDIKYGDVSFPATRGVLPEPVAGAGAQVVKKIDPSDVKKVSKDDYFLLESKATEKVKLSPGSNQLVDRNNYMIQSERVGDAMQINAVKILPEYRNQGLGKELYKSAIDDAFKKNLDLVSDNSVSESALRVYKSLENEGFNVIYNKDVFKRGSQILSKDKKQPVVTIKKSAKASDELPGIELIENLKFKKDRLGRPYLSEYQEKLKLLEELNKNKYIDPRTNKIFSPEDWLKPKKPDGTLYSEKSFASIRSKIRQGPDFLDKKAAYQRDYMRDRKSKDPEFAKTILDKKKEEYYSSTRRVKDKSIPTPGKAILKEERNRLLSYMSNKKNEVYKSGKFVGVKDPDTGIIYLDAGYKGKLKPNEKLISDHPDAAHLLDLISVAKKFKTDLPSNKILQDFFKDFKRLPTNAELFNFLSADKKFRGSMQKKRFTNNPLEIHHILGKDISATKHLQLTLRDRNDYAGKIVEQYKRNSIDYETAVKNIEKLNVRVKLPGDKKFVGGKELDALAALKVAKTRTTKMVKKEIKDNPKFAEELKDFYNNLYGEEVFKQGGRVGYKEGGSVKPKINPADYIEYYSDGTKLYKINSFIRDVANNKIL